jgi:hypothetical protein
MRENERAELILIDHEISPSQAFNLAKEVGGEVMDRTDGDPGDLPPPRSLALCARAGRDRPAGLHGAAPARSGQAGRPEGPGAQRHRRAGAAASRTASSTGARSATALPSCRRSSMRWSSRGRRSAPGGRSARVSRAWRSSAIRMRASPP